MGLRLQDRPEKEELGEGGVVWISETREGGGTGSGQRGRSLVEDIDFEVPEALLGEPSLGYWTWSQSCAWNAEPAA